MKPLLTILFVLFLAGSVFSQNPGENDSCETAAPFCTGTLYQFPATTGPIWSQIGPYYDCIDQQGQVKNPAWYFLKVLIPGDIIIEMHSSPPHDIDFCCWGPFDSQYACSQLTSPVVDCSWDTSFSEIDSILNTQTGEYYMLVITNYSNEACNIIFSQVGGTGATDCSILPAVCSNNSPICADQNLQFTANTFENATYHWTGPAGFVSDLQNPSIPNAQPVNSGNYTLIVSANGQSDTSVTIAYVYEPVADAGSDVSITYGTATTLHGSATGGSGTYHYHWEPAAQLVDPDQASPITVNLFAATLFTLTITDELAGCTSEDVVFVGITGGPLSIGAVATPSEICYGETTQLQAIASGGTGNYTYSWTGPGGFSSSVANPTVQPDVTSTYNVTVDDGIANASGTVTVTVNELPVGDAGPDDTIPFGTYTTLHGSVPGGTDTYAYSWQPADKLVNSGVQDPETVKLTATTIFSLTITNLTTNCTSETEMNVTIVVTGGALNVNPVAIPDRMCAGDSSQLHASAGGGNSGSYIYSWVSDPPGFTSNLPDPVVFPWCTTTYTVSVNDGFNTVTGNICLNVNPQPLINLPSDTLVCIYSPVILDAGNPGSTYLWSDGEITKEITVSSGGLTVEYQFYNITVTTTEGCTSSASVNILFSPLGCVGIESKTADERFRIYPNPATGFCFIEANDKLPVSVRVINLFGKTVAATELAAGESGVLFDLTTLAKGVYLVKFEAPGIVTTTRLVLI